MVESGGAKLIFGAQARSTLDGVIVQGDLDLTTGNARLLIRNRLTLTGKVLLDNSANLSFAGTQTFNTGRVEFLGNSGILGIEAGGTLTLGPAMVVRGRTGRIGQSSGAASSSKLINQGIISADVAGGTLTINPGQFQNTGTVEQKNGGKVVAP